MRLEFAHGTSFWLHGLGCADSVDDRRSLSPAAEAHNAAGCIISEMDRIEAMREYGNLVCCNYCAKGRPRAHRAARALGGLAS